MLYKTRAIVLKSIKHGESALIVQAYTEDFGKQSFLIHGVRKCKSKFGLYLFEPLSLLDLDIYYKETRDLQTVKEIKPGTTVRNIPFDIKRSSIAMFLSEILNRCLREIEPNKPLFDFLHNAIQLLNVIEEGIENFHLVFMVQLSKFLGIYPENYTRLQFSVISNEYPFDDLIKHSLQDVGKLKIGRENRQELLNRLINYYQEHLEGMGEIKSLRILQEVFDQ